MKPASMDINDVIAGTTLLFVVTMCSWSGIDAVANLGPAERSISEDDYRQMETRIRTHALIEQLYGDQEDGQ